MLGGSFDCSNERRLAYEIARILFVHVSIIFRTRPSWSLALFWSSLLPPPSSLSLVLSPFLSCCLSPFPFSLSYPQTGSLSLVCAPKTQERERNSLAWYTAINPCIYPSILWRNRHLVRLGFIAGSSAGYLPALSLFLSLFPGLLPFSLLPVSSSHYRWFNFGARALLRRNLRLLYHMNQFTLSI